MSPAEGAENRLALSEAKDVASPQQPPSPAANPEAVFKVPDLPNGKKATKKKKNKRRPSQPDGADEEGEDTKKVKVDVEKSSQKPDEKTVTVGQVDEEKNATFLLRFRDLDLDNTDSDVDFIWRVNRDQSTISLCTMKKAESNGNVKSFQVTKLKTHYFPEEYQEYYVFDAVEHRDNCVTVTFPALEWILSRRAELRRRRASEYRDELERAVQSIRRDMDHSDFMLL